MISGTSRKLDAASPETFSALGLQTPRKWDQAATAWGQGESGASRDAEVALAVHSEDDGDPAAGELGKQKLNPLQPHLHEAANSVSLEYSTS